MDNMTNVLQVKVLLLGAGESGKSTFLKQMRIIHGSVSIYKTKLNCTLVVLLGFVVDQITNKNKTGDIYGRSFSVMTASAEMSINFYNCGLNF